MVRVKICGLTRQEDVLLCSRYPVSCLGFVVEYPHPVPWNISRQRARSLMAAVPPFIATALVVGGDREAVYELAAELHPNVVQLHGEEDIDTVHALVEKLRPQGIAAIKALRLRPDGTTDFGDDPFRALKALEKTGVAAVVLDASKHNSPAGGTGEAVDWNLAHQLSDVAEVPLVLAGGLNQFNVKRAVDTVRPYAIDVLTGVEEHSGKKSAAKLKGLFAALRDTSPCGMAE